MKAAQLPDSLDKLPLDSRSKERLSKTLSRLSRDEETVLYDDRVVQLALDYSKFDKDIRRILTRLSHCKSEDGLPFGRSVGRYSSTKAVWEKFTQPTKPDFRWNRRLQKAIQKVADRYSEANLEVLPEPVTEQEFRGLLSDWSTSGGIESIISGKRTKGEILDEEYMRSFPDKMNKARRDGRFDYPIIPGFRTQCHELPELMCKHKKRPVNMVAMTQILGESLFANPVTNFLTTYKYSAIGKDDIHYLPDYCSSRRAMMYKWLSLDYSNYDSTIPEWLLDAAWEIIRGAFHGMTPDQRALFNACKQSFIVKDLITPEGLLHVTHGNPSGSKFTAIINGVVNEILTEYWADLLGRQVDYIIMGDDNLIFFTDGRPITSSEVERIANVLTSKFGIEVNPTKAVYGDYTDYPKFLSRYWKPRGAWRSTDELVSLLAYPERFRNYKSGVLTPELIIYSYILGCSEGMREWFKVDEFLANMKMKKTSTKGMWTKEVLREVPYTIRNRVELERIGILPKQLTTGRIAVSCNLVGYSA